MRSIPPRLFHAGNFADLLKHTALCELLRLLTAKDKKLFVLDTHAGAGGYDLGDEQARRTGEAEAGIARLIAEAPGRHTEGYRALFWRRCRPIDRKFGPLGGALHHYQGSPRLVRAALRPGDRFVACEKHPEEAMRLKREFAGDRAVEVRQADGYHAAEGTAAAGGAAVLVLIDPPFEATDEFEQLARAVRRAAPFPDRLLRDLVSDQRRGGGATSIAVVLWPDVKSTSNMELDLGPRVPEGASSRPAGWSLINPPWKFEEAMRLRPLPWISATARRRRQGDFFRLASQPRAPGSGVKKVMTKEIGAERGAGRGWRRHSVPKKSKARACYRQIPTTHRNPRRYRAHRSPSRARGRRNNRRPVKAQWRQSRRERAPKTRAKITRAGPLVEIEPITEHRFRRSGLGGEGEAGGRSRLVALANTKRPAVLPTPSSVISSTPKPSPRPLSAAYGASNT